MAKTYKADHLEAVAAKLRAMPPVEKKSKDANKQEAIKILAQEIKAMQTRGYSLGEIGEILRGEGIAVTTPTLKSYLQRTKPVKKAAVKAETKPDGKAKTEPKPPVGNKKETSVVAKGKFIPTPDSDEI